MRRSGCWRSPNGDTRSESIPYKALDGVVDGLTRHLVSLPLAQAQAMLPPGCGGDGENVSDAGAAGGSEQVPFAGSRNCGSADATPARLDRLAGTGLARIGDRSPQVMFIDDLHWSDSESIALLENLLRPPDAPVLLLITTFRSEQVSKHAFLQSLLEQANGKEVVEVKGEH